VIAQQSVWGKFTSVFNKISLLIFSNNFTGVINVLIQPHTASLSALFRTKFAIGNNNSNIYIPPYGRKFQKLLKIEVTVLHLHKFLFW